MMQETGSSPDGDPFDPAFFARLQGFRIIAKRAQRGNPGGGHRSFLRGGGIEFDRYRKYLPGDEFSKIDWNLYARLDKVYIREFTEDRDRAVHVLLDASGSMGRGTSGKCRLDVARIIAGSILYLTLSERDRGGLHIMGGSEGSELEGEGSVRAVIGSSERTGSFRRKGGRREIKGAKTGQGPVTSREYDPSSVLKRHHVPSRGIGSLHPMLDVLRRIRADGEIDLITSLKEFDARVSRPGVVVMITDGYFDERFREAMDLLAYRRHDVIIFHLFDAEEVSFNYRGDLTFIDMETGSPVHMTVTPAVGSAIGERIRGHFDGLRTYCTGRGFEYVPVDLDIDIFDTLLRYFSSRSRTGTRYLGSG